MEMAGSTGTNVIRAFTSQDVMHSPYPNVIDFDVVYRVLCVCDVIWECPTNDLRNVSHPLCGSTAAGSYGPKEVPC